MRLTITTETVAALKADLLAQLRPDGRVGANGMPDRFSGLLSQALAVGLGFSTAQSLQASLRAADEDAEAERPEWDTTGAINVPLLEDAFWRHLERGGAAGCRGSASLFWAAFVVAPGSLMIEDADDGILVRELGGGCVDITSLLADTTRFPDRSEQRLDWLCRNHRWRELRDCEFRGDNPDKGDRRYFLFYDALGSSLPLPRGGGSFAAWAALPCHRVSEGWYWPVVHPALAAAGRSPISASDLRALVRSYADDKREEVFACSVFDERANRYREFDVSAPEAADRLYRDVVRGIANRYWLKFCNWRLLAQPEANAVIRLWNEYVRDAKGLQDRYEFRDRAVSGQHASVTGFGLPGRPRWVEDDERQEHVIEIGLRIHGSAFSVIIDPGMGWQSDRRYGELVPIKAKPVSLWVVAPDHLGNHLIQGPADQRNAMRRRDEAFAEWLANPVPHCDLSADPHPYLPPPVIRS